MRSGKVNCSPWLNDFVFLGLMRKMFIIRLLREHYVCQHLNPPSTGGDIYGLHCFLPRSNAIVFYPGFVSRSNAADFDVLHLDVLHHIVSLCMSVRVFHHPGYCECLMVVSYWSLR